MLRAIETADSHLAGGGGLAEFHERIARDSYCRPGGKGKPYEWEPVQPLYRQMMGARRQARLEERQKAEEDAKRLGDFRAEVERGKEERARAARLEEAARLEAERQSAEAREAYRVFVHSEVDAWAEANPEEFKRRCAKHPLCLRARASPGVGTAAEACVKADVEKELELPAFEEWIQPRAGPKAKPAQKARRTA